MSSVNIITSKLEQLPPRALKQANDFIDFLHLIYARQRINKKPGFPKRGDNKKT